MEELKLLKKNRTPKKSSGGILKNLAIMVGVLITITFAVTKSITWVNTVPKDLEIKITLMKNVEDKMVGFRIDLSMLANDYSKALRDNDVDMQQRLIKYAKDKYGITKETLDGIDKDLIKNIVDGADAWDKVFSETLSDEENKQYQAELVKLYRVKETELNNLLEQEKEYQNEINRTLAGKSGLSFQPGLLVTKYKKSELKEPIKEAREELAILAKLIDESNKKCLKN